jgi:hypothetical protein
MDLRAFRDRTRHDFFTGDVDAVREMVNKINNAPVPEPEPADGVAAEMPALETA